jgi:hypothetical protein
MMARKQGSGEDIWASKERINRGLENILQREASLSVLSAKIIRVGNVARMGERRGAHGNVVGKFERKSPLVGPRYRRKHNIKINLTENRLGGRGRDSCGLG